MTPARNERPGRTAPTVGRDVECSGCGYNLRGAPIGARCPECGEPIARSMPRAGPDRPDEREQASEAVRNVARSWLLATPLGAFAMSGCLSGPAAALAVLGAGQRLIGLRACRRHLREVGVSQPATERLLTACTIAELALGSLGVLLRIGGSDVPGAVTNAVCGLHFGAALLSAVPTASLLASIGRAVDDDTAPATGALPWLFGAAAGIAAAVLLLGLGVLGGIAWPVMLASAAAWAWGMSLLAFAGSSVAGEVGMPRRGGGRDGPAPRAVEPPAPRPITRPEDESPIPY